MNADLPDAFPPAPPLTGEGAPALLVAALAAMGATLAVVSASMWLAPPAGEPVTIVVHEPAPPPKIIEVPVPAPAPPPKIIEVKVPVPAPAPPPQIIEVKVPVPAPAPPPPCFDPVSIMFARGKSAPLPGADADRAMVRAGIERLSSWLNKHSDAKVVVAGHADALGTEENNLVLSFARAKAVSSLLASNGLPAARQTLRAAGAGEAAASIDPRDRRVDISVEGVTPCKSATGATEQHP